MCCSNCPCEVVDCQRCKPAKGKWKTVLFANELVSVQPMQLPSALLFYIDYKFGDIESSGSVSPRPPKTLKE